MNLIESLLHALKDHGARQIFGIPGDFALPYFRIIEESKILPLYTLSHEPGVGFAADAAARINGSLGVAAVTYGAGALNMINSIAAAFAEKSPLVVLSGGPGKGESRSGLLLHHQAKTLDSQFQIFKEITCDQVRLDDADMVNEPCAPVVPEAPQAVDPDALAACVDEILARLASARSPVLMAGVEVRRYGLEAQVAQLARRLGVPVVTSFMGRGLLADQEVPLLGTYMGVRTACSCSARSSATPTSPSRRPRSTCARRSRRWMAASPSATTPIPSCRWPRLSNACWPAWAGVTSHWP